MPKKPHRTANDVKADLARLQRQNRELLALVGELTLRLSVAQKRS